ncbi:CheR family methyltransferase [Flexithrix dorotheae]|uniref:CheR family methyltransferase n=1 Tax=Flexithrix dorotheae TaxID=70993 RepID=UPI00037EE891|nr:CheR family methyltransferase [Flexithrix dorotheae]
MNNNQIDVDLKLFHHIIDIACSSNQLNLNQYQGSFLHKGISSRMEARGEADLSNYYEFLKEDHQEKIALSNTILDGSSGFFQEAEAFDQLLEEVIPNLFQNNNSNLRIWVPACATGEEAYSIAILLLEYQRKHNLQIDFKIFASDVLDERIAFATKGIFKPKALIDIPKGLIDKYFIKGDNFFEVNRQVRNKISFVRHDLISNPYFINVDLISCRNILKDLLNSAQKKILITFQKSLNNNGFLFLGEEESSIISEFNQEAFFKGEKYVFKYLKNIVVEEKKSPELLPNQNDVLESKHKTEKYPTESYKELLLDHFASPCIIVNQNLDIIYSAGEISKFLIYPQNAQQFNLKNMVSKYLIPMFMEGVNYAIDQQATYRIKDVPIIRRDKNIKTKINFIPKWHQETLSRVILIEFISEEVSNFDLKNLPEVFNLDNYTSKQLHSLEQMFFQLKKEKEVSEEKLNTVNEQLNLSNEELMTTNEEMQTTNEELQSLNEELYTVNAELQEKNKELKNLNNDINNLLLGTDIGTIFLDNELKIRKFTPAINRQFHITELDTGRPIYHFSTNFGYASLRQDINKVLAEKNPIQREILNNEGNYYLMRINPFLTEKNNVKGVVITFVDITELEKLKLRLERSEELHRTLISKSATLTWRTDGSGKMNGKNKQWEGFTGQQFEKYQDLGWINSLHADDKNLFINIWKGAIGNKEFFRKEARIYNQQTNDYHYFVVNAVPFLNKDNTIREWFVALTDVNDIKKAEENLKKINIQLEKTNQYLDSFVYTAAHDLRAPIINLKNLFGLFNDITDKEMKQSVNEKIKYSIDKLEGTLNGLIEIIDTQKNENKDATLISLRDFTKEVINEIDSQITQAKVKINLDIEQVPSIKYNVTYLHSILLNLISNSVKYSSPERDPYINISAQKENGFVVVKVKDNGIGMDLEKYGHLLFKPFQRFTTDRPGKGIGLNIIKNMVEKNGGKILVESQLEKGTQFNVYLKEY